MSSKENLRFYVRVTSAFPLRDNKYMFYGVFVRGSHRSNKVSARSYAAIYCSESKFEVEPRVGQIYELLGKPEVRIKDDSGYEMTEVSFVEPYKIKIVLPETAEEFIGFISKEKDFVGIGEAKARLLFDTFGGTVFEILSQKDITSLKKVLTVDSAEALIAGYRKYENLRYASWFAEKKIPPRVQARLFRYHKANSVEQVKENPYLLQHFGLSFEETDNIAQMYFDIEEDDLRRLNAMVESAMRDYCSEGHTVADVSILFSRIASLANDEDLAEEAIINAHSSLAVYYDPNSERIHNTGTYIMEKVIAKRLAKLSQKHEWLTVFDESHRKALEGIPFPLSYKQGEAVVRSLETKVLCITGGAGTGKTTVLKAIVDAYRYSGFKIFATALSGRATKRLSESIHMPTYTIHRLAMLDESEFESDKPTLLIIDETSMVDILSLYRLIMKIPPSTRIIFVGDDAQLAPIGSGLVLSEIVRSDVVSTVKLDVVQRQKESSGIPFYSNQVRKKIIPENLSFKNISFKSTPYDSLVDSAVELYLELGGNCQIITPTRKLTREINEHCQAIKNPYGKKVFLLFDGEFEDVGLRLNDPVIFTKNDYKLDIQNGTLGKIIEVCNHDLVKAIVKVETDTGAVIDVTYNHIDDLELAYAITLHKAQGSQFEQVIVPLFRSRVMDNSWVYTAITRAEKSLYFLGSEKVLREAITTETAVNKRQVSLSSLLIDEVEKLSRKVIDA
ncbi:ATP-dependent RecD-like DNA helicase [Vibrio diabolicus]|uniref:ATP-dependent RecD-like DNA helicase n=1 Tax=Vibrio diabolicus TaxID=50719 RepID=UPI00211B69A0|nr:ATP-dependent RecD-like DNA helicase [Vibrio diabolicus]MCG9618592.1 ATP-dependent RecD-like DNA helicase [Vibrio diabolicus]